jgi:hypothetical protein
LEQGDGQGPLQFMFQKAGAEDNTLGPNGWQSSSHWFVANPLDSADADGLVWVRLSPAITRHLSFANYRVSTKREGGKVCMGVLSGGTSIDRPDTPKANALAAVAVPSSLGDLPELPAGFTKTNISIPENEPTSVTPPVPVTLAPVIIPELPVQETTKELVQVVEAPLINANTTSANLEQKPTLSTTKVIEPEKKSNTPKILVIVLAGLIALGLGGYFLTKGKTKVPAEPSIPATPPIAPPSAPVVAPPVTPPPAEPSVPVTPTVTPPPAPVTPPPATPSVPATPPKPVTQQVPPQPVRQQPLTPPKPSPRPPVNEAPAMPDVNKIVKDAMGK